MRCQVKKLVASGNWSNPAIWDEGVLPNTDSIVILNGFNLNVDQSATVRGIGNNGIGQYSVSLVPQYYNETQAFGDQSLVGEILYGGSVDTLTQFPFYAFDQFWTSVNGFFRYFSASPSTPVYIGYRFPTATIVDKFRIQQDGLNDANNATDIDFEASNDGVTWVTLFSTNVSSPQIYVSPSFNTTTAYTHYRLAIYGIRSGSTGHLSSLEMFNPNTSTDGGANGGSVTFDSADVGGLILTCTDPVVGLFGGNVNGSVFTYAGSKNFTLISHIQRNHAFSGSAFVPLINHNGTGTLNIQGTVRGNRKIVNNIFDVDEPRHYVPFANRYARALQSSTVGTTNLVGDVEIDTLGASSEYFVFNLSNHNFNQTGDWVHIFTGGSGLITNAFFANNCNINFSGSVNVRLGRASLPTSSSQIVLFNFGNCQVNFTGDWVGEYNGANNFLRNDASLNWTGSETKTISWIGKIETQGDGYVFNPVSTDGIMISGPVVSSPYGWFPIGSIQRINWIQNTVNTYMQFRTNEVMFNQQGSTPSGIYNLVSPDTLADLPAGDDVRLGTVYGAGSFQGTLAVPPADRVSAGVPVDDTVGTGTITAQDVWDHLVADINTPDSIGERLKNAATVETTGSQIASFNS